MIKGVLRHCTEMTVEKQFVDTHGQDEVAFGFCRLLSFELMPRIKNIGKQKLYRPKAGEPDAYPNLKRVLNPPINWTLIEQQYDQMIKYATAMRLGTAETEAILNRFKRTGPQHPTYLAFIFYGRSSEFASNRLADQELSALSLHLLQICLVYVNTLLIQRVLAELKQFKQMKKEDLRALTPLIYSHVTPYGTFRLDLSERIQIEDVHSA